MDVPSCINCRDTSPGIVAGAVIRARHVNDLNTPEDFAPSTVVFDSIYLSIYIYIIKLKRIYHIFIMKYN